MPRSRRSAHRPAVVEANVRALARGGDGVVEAPRGLWFVPDVLPGERVRVREVDRKGGVTRGKLLEVLESSPGRVAPECPHQAPCGGCPLMHASLEVEQEIKRAWLAQLLEHLHYGQLPVEWFPAPSHEHYRTRARLFWKRRGKAPARIGFRRARSQEVVDIPDCRVLDAQLDATLGALRVELAPALQGTGEIALALGERGVPVVVLRTSDVQPPEVYAKAEAFAQRDSVAGVALTVGEGTQPALWGDPAEQGRALDGSPLAGTVGGFSQANAAVNRQLVAFVKELALTQDARVRELYAGHGNFTVELAPGSARYTAVEQDDDAARQCDQNLRQRGLEAVKVVAGAAEEHVGKGPLDVLVLDPPRTGARGVLDAALARKPHRIVYVSCNIATLERDLREVLGKGYMLDRVAGFDMFPRTAQLESVVRLTRQG